MTSIRVQPDQKLAAQEADQALAPLLAALNEQKAAEELRARNAQATATAGAAGLAQVLGGIAPQIQQDYQQAAGATGAFAKGYSAAFQEGSEKMAAQLQGLLDPASPQRIQGAGAAGADVLFGLGGSIPGQALAREGAAFTAAARQLPGTARLVGQQQSGAIGADSAEKLRQLDMLLRQEKAKRPALVREALSDIRKTRFEQQQAEREFALKERAAQVNEAAIRSQIGDREFDNLLNAKKASDAQANARDRLDLELARIKNERARIGLQQKKLRFDQGLAAAKLELDEKDYELAAKKELRLGKSPKKGGFTAKQRQGMAETAVASARDAVELGMKPVDVLRDLIASGVPFSIAIKAIQRFGRSAGADNFWKATLGWTKKKKQR